MTTREIKIYKDSRNLALGNMQDLGVERDNKVIKLKFIFDEFVDGEAELLTNIKGSDGNLLPFKLTKNVEDKSYELIVEDYMLVNNRLTFQLQIVCIDNVVWHSKQSELSVNECLVVGEGEMPDIVSNWLISADLKLVEIDEKETQISLAEKDRVQSEQERVNNENSRINSENNRIVEEQVREENEEIRSLNETQRETNEQKRISNESERVEYINNLKKDVEEGKFDGKDGVDGKDYILTEEDENNIADKVEVKIEPKLASNLRESKEYTDNSNLFDIKDVSYDEDSAVLTFTRHDDTKIIIDLPLEIALKDGYYDDSTKELVLVLMNNQEIRIPASGLIDDYSTEDSVTIQLNISADNVITASIKGQSISKTLLTLELQEEINNKVNKTDYATHLSGGVIKVNSNDSGIYINESGFLKATKFTLSNYNQKKASIFVSKGTLDEVLEPIKNDIINNTEDIKDNTIRIRRLESDVFDSGEASGDVIHIEDSTLAEAIEIEGDGVLKQKTTEGLQLGIFEAMISNDNVTVEKNGNTYKLTGNGKSSYQNVNVPFWNNFKDKVKPGMKLSFDCKSFSVLNQNCISVAQIIVYFNDGTAAKYQVLYNFRTDGRWSYTIPDNIDDIKIIELRLYTDNRALDLVETNTIIIEEPILYLGDIDNPPKFEKYTGGIQSPNPDYPQDIEVIESGDYEIVTTEKNIFNYNHKQASINYGIETKKNLDGSFTFKGTPIRDYITLIPYDFYDERLIDGECYTISQNIPSFIYIQVQAKPFDSNSPTIYLSSSNSPTKKSQSFVVDKSKYKYYIGVQSGLMNNVGEDIDLTLFFQLEKGDTVTEFEPYIESKLSIRLSEGEFKAKLSEEVKDKHYVKINEDDGQYHLYFEKQIGRKKINNASDIHLQSINQYNIANFYIKLNKNSNDKNKGLSKCNYFIFTHELIASVKKESFTLSGSDVVYFRLDANRVSNVNEFKEWIKDKEIFVYYLLAEPYVLDLGVIDMPLTYNKITNVYSDFPLNSTLHLKYYRNFKETIYTLQNSNELANSKIAKLEVDMVDLQNKVNQLMTSTISEEVNNEDLREE